MRDRFRRLICRIKGHDHRVLGRWGGLPESEAFGIDADCRRCGEDLSVFMPSRMTFYNARYYHANGEPKP